MFKYTLPSFVKFAMPYCTWKVNTHDKVLYLTFDDGPHPVITPQVLELLNKYNAKATFFCVADNVKKFPDTYHQILENGHKTGNHTFHHLNNFKVSDESYLNNIALAETYINSTLFRPPYGRIKPGVAKKLSSRYKIIMWSHLSRDYDVQVNIAQSIRAMKKAKEGSILVFHDSEKAINQLNLILPSVLEHFSNLGFSFQSL